MFPHLHHHDFPTLPNEAAMVESDCNQRYAFFPHTSKQSAIWSDEEFLFDCKLHTRFLGTDPLHSKHPRAIINSVDTETEQLQYLWIEKGDYVFL